jgi:hypothetical protein
LLRLARSCVNSLWRQALVSTPSSRVNSRATVSGGFIKIEFT